LGAWFGFGRAASGQAGLGPGSGRGHGSSDDPQLAEQRFDVVLEATGRPQGLAQALDLVRPEGTVIAKTTSHKPSSLDLAKLVVDEITLLGSRCGDMGLALHFLKNRLVDPEPMVQAEFPLAQAKQAFTEAAQTRRAQGAYQNQLGQLEDTLRKSS
jgi:threonine dehydrogenase-like Zn-dependent dehydrogenase